MVEIPTMKDEDAKRPNREHDSLIGERKSDRQPNEGSVGSARHPRLHLSLKGPPCALTACSRLKASHFANALAELRRDMERRRLVNNQIRQIEEERLERIEQAPSDGTARSWCAC